MFFEKRGRIRNRIWNFFMSYPDPELIEKSDPELIEKSDPDP
jgi:hypothetical protein